ncbi:MAG: hypothetical protein ACHQHP_03285 [Bacteroidia bacterium]
MYKIIFLIAASFTSFFSYGQDGLMIKNNKNGKVWMYEKGSTVTYIKFHEEEYSTGILNALIDTSAVVFGKDTILIKDIAGIRKRSALHIMTRIIGIPLMLVGSIIMADGAVAIYKNPDAAPGIEYVLVGAGIFAVGYLPYQLNLQDLNVGFRGEWTIKIIRW